MLLCPSFKKICPPHVFLLNCFKTSSMYDVTLPIKSGVDHIEGKCSGWYLKWLGLKSGWGDSTMYHRPWSQYMVHIGLQSVSWSQAFVLPNDIMKAITVVWSIWRRWMEKCVCGREHVPALDGWEGFKKRIVDIPNIRRIAWWNGT